MDGTTYVQKLKFLLAFQIKKLIFLQKRKSKIRRRHLRHHILFVMFKANKTKSLFFEVKEMRNFTLINVTVNAVTTRRPLSLLRVAKFDQTLLEKDLIFGRISNFVSRFLNKSNSILKLS